MNLGWRYWVWFIMSIIILSNLRDFISIYCSERMNELFHMGMITNPILVVCVFLLEGVYQLLKWGYKKYITKQDIKNKF